MNSRKQVPVALTIAGSDSGGGAGIQADLKTFAALGVHGTTAITCLTAQNPARVTALQPSGPEMVLSQIAAVFEAFPPAAIKTGMLYSAPTVRAVGRWFELAARVPLIVDPVMVSTSGTPLLKGALSQALARELLPRCTLVTPNLAETSVLLGDAPVQSIADMRESARLIQRQFGCAALIKGGHLQNVKEAVDVFYDGKTELLLTAPFIPGIATHGTGCTYSAAITAWLALGYDLARSVKRAKEFVTRSIARSYRVGWHDALG